MFNFRDQGDNDFSSITILIYPIDQNDPPKKIQGPITPDIISGDVYTYLDKVILGHAFMNDYSRIELVCFCMGYFRNTLVLRNKRLIYKLVDILSATYTVKLHNGQVIGIDPIPAHRYESSAYISDIKEMYPGAISIGTKKQPVYTSMHDVYNDKEHNAIHDVYVKSVVGIIKDDVESTNQIQKDMATMSAQIVNINSELARVTKALTDEGFITEPNDEESVVEREICKFEFVVDVYNPELGLPTNHGFVDFISPTGDRKTIMFQAMDNQCPNEMLDNIRTSTLNDSVILEIGYNWNSREVTILPYGDKAVVPFGNDELTLTNGEYAVMYHNDRELDWNRSWYKINISTRNHPSQKVIIEFIKEYTDIPMSDVIKVEGQKLANHLSRLDGSSATVTLYFDDRPPAIFISN